MIYVIIDCFTGIWTRFAFPFHAAFHYPRLMQIRWRQSEIPFSPFTQSRLFTVFFFTTEACEIYPVCLKPSQYGIDLIKMPLRVLRISVKSGLDGQQNTSRQAPAMLSNVILSNSIRTNSLDPILVHFFCFSLTSEVILCPIISSLASIDSPPDLFVAACFRTVSIPPCCTVSWALYLSYWSVRSKFRLKSIFYFTFGCISMDGSVSTRPSSLAWRNSL